MLRQKGERFGNIFKGICFLTTTLVTCIILFLSCPGPPEPVNCGGAPSAQNVSVQITAEPALQSPLVLNEAVIATPEFTLEVSQQLKLTGFENGTGCVPPGLIWYVNDVEGGNDEFGIISVMGNEVFSTAPLSPLPPLVLGVFYTAPPAVPTPSTVEIYAQSEYFGVISNKIIVNIVPPETP